MGKKNKKELTLEQKRKLLLTPCKTKQEAAAWIKYFLGLDLPSVTVSRHANTNPLDTVWEMYSICVLKNNPNNIQELLYTASRGSGKCVEKGTKILTKKGPLYIESIKKGDTVFTGWNWRPVKEFFDEGVKAGVRITTSIGKFNSSASITGSLKHRIQALDEKGELCWRYISDLRTGDYVYKSARGLFTVDQNSRHFHEGWILGNIVGDGHVQLDKKYRKITVCGSDIQQLNYLGALIKRYWNVPFKVKSNSANSYNYIFYSSALCDWFESLIGGKLAYDKALKTTEHPVNFLAGFISGIMETDGSKDSICLANKELILQVSEILSVFGVVTSINNSRKKPRYSKFTNNMVTYHSCEYKTPLQPYLMPLFSKKAAFEKHAKSMNQQFRFPAVIASYIANYVNRTYRRNNGYVFVDGVKKRLAFPYAKDFFSDTKDRHIYKHKIEATRDWFNRLNDVKMVKYLDFLVNGFFEKVSSVESVDAYFYDLEIEETHSYWSNGFISHNTLGTAIAEFMILLHDQRDIAHVGAIMAQAKRAYEYIQGFCLSPNVKPILNPPDVPDDQKILQKSTMEKSIFKVNDQICTMEILPTTMKALNGLHVSLVSTDELDTLSGESLRAIKEVSGMLDTKKGKKPLRVGISTRKSKHGLMNKMIENADKEGRHLRFWTALEFTEKCPDSRSGTVKTNYWINVEGGEVLSEEEFSNKDKNKKNEYFLETSMFDRCKTCPVAVFCRGDAKKQTSTSNMLKTIDELNQKIKAEGYDWASSQLFNLKPSSEGIIFREFEEKVHVKDWNQMWYILTGKEFPGECTHDMFVKKCHEMNLPCYAGIDWGFSAPNTVVFFFVDKRENIYVVKCDGMTFISQPTWIHHIKTKYHNMYRCQLYVPDSADQGAIQEMKKAGLPVANQTDKGQIMTGIQVIKKFLKVPGSSDPKMFFAKDTCQPIVQEMGLYHYKLDAAGLVTDDPDTEHDHWIDALRYPVTMLFGKSVIVLGGGLDFDSASNLTDSMGNFSRMPTATEFAQQNGIRINDTEQDTSKLGKIGTKTDLDESSDDDGVGGSGSFLWNF